MSYSIISLNSEKNEKKPWNSSKNTIQAIAHPATTRVSTTAQQAKNLHLGAGAP